MLAGLPPGQVVLAGFARRFRVLVDVPARMSPSPSWFALTGTAPALVAAAAAMSGPELPPSLAAAAANERVIVAGRW